MGGMFRLHPIKMPFCSTSAFFHHARTAALICLLYTFSIGLTFYNKRYITLFPVPLSITMLHLLVKFILSGLWRTYQSKARCAGACKGEAVTVSWRTYVTRIAPTGIASALDIGFSNWSFEFISVSLYTMTKSTCIVFVLFFAVLLGLERKRWSAVVVVVLIAAGLFMFTYRSTAFNLSGFLLVLAAAFVSGLRWTFSQLLLSPHKKAHTHAESGVAHEQDHHSAGGMVSPVDLCFHLQPVMILTLLPLSATFEGVALVTNDDLVLAESYTTLLCNFLVLSFGALLAFALELTEYVVISWTSSITLSIAGIVKEVATLGLAAFIHGDLQAIAPLNAVGLLLCLLGISLHVFLKARSQSSPHPHQDSAATSSHPVPTIMRRFKNKTKSNSVRYSKLRNDVDADMDAEIDSDADSSAAESGEELTHFERLPTRASTSALSLSTSLSSQSQSTFAPSRANTNRWQSN